MPEYLHPGVYVEEIGRAPKPIEGVETSIAALLGETERGSLRPAYVTSVGDFELKYGSGGPYLAEAVRGFFGNGGRRALICRLRTPADLPRILALLERRAFRDVALVAAPGLVEPGQAAAIIGHCEAQRRFAVLDCLRTDPAMLDPRADRASKNAACYVPWLDLSGRYAPPSGHVLGVYAHTDVTRGVWKAPANEVVRGAVGVEHEINQAVQEQLNPRGVNVIRRLPGRGIRVWGARTLSDDAEWKYVNVRRLFLYLERSIDEGTQWVVFEPNAVPLWAAVRNQVEQFLTLHWRMGALAGAKPEEAFFVRCDRSTMTQEDIDNGHLIVEIGFAPVRPAEFLIFRIFQRTSNS